MKNSDNQLVTVRAGIDWLTLTVKRDVFHVEQIVYAWQRAFGLLAAEGNEQKEQRWNGYEGWSVAGSFYGERDDGWMFQLAGQCADEHFATCYNPKCNVPRIDLQVTCWYAREDLATGREVYAAAMEHNQGLPVQRRRKVYLICGSDGGDTCYVGAPGAETRIRVYNKARQSEAAYYQNAWRYEVVWKNALAAQVAEWLAERPDSRADYSRRMVAATMVSRGITCPWTDEPSLVALPTQAVKPTDAQRKLTWLAEQVKPSVQWLISEGFEQEVLDALALSDVPFSV